MDVAAKVVTYLLQVNNPEGVQAPDVAAAGGIDFQEIISAIRLTVEQQARRTLQDHQLQGLIVRQVSVVQIVNVTVTVR